jgi:hypothetical protein
MFGATVRNGNACALNTPIGAANAAAAPARNNVRRSSNALFRLLCPDIHLSWFLSGTKPPSAQRNAAATCYCFALTSVS